MKKIWYSVPEINDTRYESEITQLACVERRSEQIGIAETCAEDFFDRGNLIWPQTISLFATHDGPVIASLLVVMDMSPTFTAYSKKEPVPTPEK
jgi:hypothetical protein